MSTRIAVAVVTVLGLADTRSLAQAQAPARASATTAFIGVSVIPMDRERVLADQTVVVQGDRIVAMGAAARVRVPDDAVRIDGRDKFLMPGLADMHMHVGFRITDPRDAEQILFLLLANGVTTIRNLDYDGPASRSLPGEELLRLRSRVASGELLGPRIYTAGQWYADTSTSVVENLEAYKAAGYDLIKVHHDVDTPLDKLDSLVEAAGRIGIPIAGHPVGGLAFALRHRFASLEHLDGFPGQEVSQRSLADTSSIPALVAATREAGVRITPTRAIIEAFTVGKLDPHYYRGKRYVPARLHVIYGYADRHTAAVPTSAAPPDTTTAARIAATEAVEGAEVRRRVIQALQAAGVELLLGTDSPLLLPGYGVHQELDGLVGAGLTPYQALVTGTRNVATYFGTLDSTGTVAVGKRADVVLLDANPLADIRHAEQIAGVMAAGRWLSKADIERRLDAYAARTDSSSVKSDATPPSGD